MTDRPYIEAVKLCKSYKMPHGVVEVLTELSLEVKRGEHLCIMGASGSGKSTLLHLLAGLDTPDSGEVRVENERLNEWSESRRSAFRARHVGVVFHHYHLLPDLTVLENALLPVRALKTWGSPDREQVEGAKTQLDRVGLGHRLDHRPVELSGGEQQRLALARALMNDPELLLADEPTGNLDAVTGDQLLDDLFELSRERNRTLVIVTHDPRLAERCHRTFHLS
ncbi:MAG: ABC transporter ATP-binding protein [Kiritimatiellae bacterium]|jgi:predicted ABC-type transport system involved in lysophospholipase L1 biosynthesis ATPase subunit|nr:ABC transporter ATP-binding protein [Kiritimatiellia bacterium]